MSELRCARRNGASFQSRAGVGQGSRAMITSISVCWVMTWTVVAAGPVQSPFRLDPKILEQLQAADPKAASLFAEARQACLTRDHARSRQLYARVHDLVPSFDSTRYEAAELKELGERGRAIELGRMMVAGEASAENLSWLAWCL